MIARLLFSLTFLSMMFASSQSALFSQLPTAPWSPRQIQQWSHITKSFTYILNSQQVTAQPGNIIAYGGALSGSVNYNDVYISTDGAQSWTLIGGTGVSGDYGTNTVTRTNSSNLVSAFAQDDSGACKTYDPLTGIFYVMDETYAWYSTDAVNWAKTSTVEYDFRTSAACFVDPQSKLFILGGQSAGSNYENDVWVSGDNGHTFARATATAAFTQRDSQAAFSYVTSSGAKVAYALGGHAKVEDVRPSDVYISSDSGASWILLTKAPWAGRDHFRAVVTSNNIIVMAGGKVDAFAGNSTSRHLGMNDVWASLDGGYTWGNCGNAEWIGRQDYMMSIDANGFIYFGGGNAYVNANNGIGFTLQKDAWKSVMSFSNAANVASACGLTVPTCGLGLRGWPVFVNANQSTFTPTGCNNNNGGNGASSSASAVFAFVTVFIAAIVALMF